MTTSANDETIPFVPPQLPPFPANVFNLKPILGRPNCEEVKLVHEAIRALNNFPHISEQRNTDLSIELSQHLFDIQMSTVPSTKIPHQCATKRAPPSLIHIESNPISHIAVAQDIVYDPPTLPDYIPVELKPVTGPPSNKEVASVHAALRISEGFANVPSIFDPDLHTQLAQHLFDIQLVIILPVLHMFETYPSLKARHVQRSITKRMAPATSTPQNQAVSHRDSSDTDANNTPEAHTSPSVIPGQDIGSTETQHPALEQSSFPNEATSHQILSDINEHNRST
ncbi:hypothetical protein RSAG8_13735, partial [Rhizoctonia solani AG-8 WAC10335]